MKKSYTAIILAGGNSRRMGFDKQFMQLDENWLLMKVAKQLESVFDEIIIVTNKKEFYKETPYKVVTDVIKGGGPLAGIYTGLINSSNPYNYVIACDMPIINVDYIDYMKQKIEENPKTKGIITRFKDMYEPFNAFYSKDLVSSFESAIKDGKRKIMACMKAEDIFYIDESIARKYSDDWRMFVNLNTKHDLMKYKELVG